MNHKLCVASILLLAAGPAAAAPAITVNVNGTPVSFQGAPPTQIGGAVLVPLRGVFQALDASVNYNSATRTITAQKGTTSVVLPIGSMAAMVNGQPQALSQPAQSVGGTTLVPLRFVAQALGASVQWNAASSTVDIKTLDPHLASLPGLPAGSSAVTGVLTGTFLSTNPPTLTVRVDGDNRSVPLVGAYTVTSALVGQTPQKVNLSDLRVGDQVTVIRDASGSVSSVTAMRGEVRGTVKSITPLSSGGSLVLFNDGKTVELIPHAQVRMAGRSVALSDVLPNEDVVVRTGVGNTYGYALDVMTPGTILPPASPTTVSPAGQVVTITSLTQDAAQPLKKGDALHVILIGTPGGQASFSIPGLAESVPLKETSSGTYTGTLSVPASATLSGASVLGKLTVNGVTAPLVQAAGTVAVDTQAPTVADLSPAKGAATESVRPLLYATLSDGGGSGVDTSRVQVLLDGTDVTDKATITPAFFNVTPSAPLSAGAHVVSVSVADKAGNVRKAEWSFSVSPSELVQEFTSDAPADGTLEAGQTVHFTLRAQAGGQATAAIGTTASGIALKEAKPGVYTGDYLVKPGDSVQNAPVSARFVAAGGKTVTANLPGTFTLAAGALKKPVIILPTDGAQVGDTVAAEGKAAPNGTVRVTVSYTSKALGGLFNLNGTSATQDVRADKNGVWKTDDLSLKAGSGLLGKAQDTVFTITAESVSADGTLSDPATVSVRH